MEAETETETTAAVAAARIAGAPSELRYVQYQHSLESRYLPAIRALITKDLSEPYSIYVYRYFLYQWAHLCYMVRTAVPGEPTSCGGTKPTGRVGPAVCLVS